MKKIEDHTHKWEAMFFHKLENNIVKIHTAESNAETQSNPWQNMTQLPGFCQWCQKPTLKKASSSVTFWRNWISTHRKKNEPRSWTQHGKILELETLNFEKSRGKYS